jgi:ribonuclease P protein component
MATRRPWERLTRRPEFLRVAASRRRWTTPGLILQVAESPAPGAETFRLGFTASRKVGGAVERNRARRRLRAAAALLMPRSARRGADYVLIARAATVARPFAGLMSDLETALRRLQAWRDEGDPGVKRTPAEKVSQ